jgi:hypothetical protein
LETVIECGGDTDTVAAIAGTLAGATVGESGIPQDWIDGIFDAPINVGLLLKTAERLADSVSGNSYRGADRYCWILLIPRNLFFLSVVLLHGIRRLLPPYWEKTQNIFYRFRKSVCFEIVWWN